MCNKIIHYNTNTNPPKFAKMEVGAVKICYTVSDKTCAILYPFWDTYCHSKLVKLVSSPHKFITLHDPLRKQRY